MFFAVFRTFPELRLVRLGDCTFQRMLISPRVAIDRLMLQCTLVRRHGGFLLFNSATGTRPLAIDDSAQTTPVGTQLQGSTTIYMPLSINNMDESSV